MPEPTIPIQNVQSAGKCLNLDEFETLKSKFRNNPIISYLNINHLRNKIVDLRPIMRDLEPTVLAIAETKLNDSYPSSQFRVDGYYCPSEYRKDRDYNGGGGILVYIRQGIPAKRLQSLEPKGIESIFFEITLGKQKWCIIATYRSEDVKVVNYLDILSKSLDLVYSTYENVILMGDININFLNKCSPKFKKLDTFCDTFSLYNLIKSPTCFQADIPTSLDLILTNKNKSFINSNVVITGLSDWHGMVTTMTRTHVKKLPPKSIRYRSFKRFNEADFLHDIQEITENRDATGEVEPFESLAIDFLNVIDKHAPFKSKILRGNDAPFMTSELRREIRFRSKLSKIARTEKTAQSRLAFQKQRNKCTKLKFKNKKVYFEKVTADGGKRFWQAIKPFVSDKGGHGNEEYVLEENGSLLKDPEEISRIFVNYYTHILEHSTGNPPVQIPFLSNSPNGKIDEILSYYEDHESIMAIKNKFTNLSFTIPEPTEQEIYDILKTLDIKKATGVDTIPPKLIRLSADLLKTPFTKSLKFYISKYIFPDKMKPARVTPIYKNPKEGSRLDKTCYRPVSVLTTFSKVFERFILNSMLEYTNKILSDHISAYRQGYSCQNVLLKLTEKWRQHLDNNQIVGAVLMDLSKAFDCLPHELLIAKLSAYGFDKNTLMFFYSYLKERQQCVSIKGKSSMFLEILAGVPQGSILGPVLFNIFINDFIDIFKNTDPHNFADDNTLSAYASNLDSLIKKLEIDSDKAINWFTRNHMIANPDKFKAIIIQKDRRDTSGIKLNINNAEILSEKEVTLLGIDIDNKLSFDSYLSKICKKASNILNALKRQSKFIVGTKCRTLMANTYILSYFNYCPLVWHFCGPGSTHKIEKIHERVLRWVHNDYASAYSTILKKSNSSTLYLKRVRIIAHETFKIINNESPLYSKELIRFRNSRYPTRNTNVDTYIPRVNQVKFGKRSFTYEAPVLWNSLPNEIRTVESFSVFKGLMKTWGGSSCRCTLCNYSTLNE